MGASALNQLLEILNMNKKQNRNYNPQTILQILLDTIDFEGDKEQFNKGFIEASYQVALINTIEQLPLDVQEEVKRLVEKKELNEEKVSSLIPTDKLTEEFYTVFETNMNTYLKTITSTLTEEQREKLLNLKKK